MLYRLSSSFLLLDWRAVLFISCCVSIIIYGQGERERMCVYIVWSMTELVGKAPLGRQMVSGNGFLLFWIYDECCIGGHMEPRGNVQSRRFLSKKLGFRLFHVMAHGHLRHKVLLTDELYAYT